MLVAVDIDIRDGAAIDCQGDRFFPTVAAFSSFAPIHLRGFGGHCFAHHGARNVSRSVAAVSQPSRHGETERRQPPSISDLLVGRSEPNSPTFRTSSRTDHSGGLPGTDFGYLLDYMQLARDRQ